MKSPAHSPSRRHVIKVLGTAPLLGLLPRDALAAYPEKPIRLVVPFAPGGNADIVGRIVAAGMAQHLGQPMLVDNRAGAGGGVGAGQVARAAPDGYTLLSGSNGPLTVNPFVMLNPGYDSLKDFAPIGLTSVVPHALIVHPAVPARTVAELVELSRRQQVGVGTSGVGSATHLTLERFNAQTGAKLVHVPYKSGGALLPDLMGATIPAAMTEFSAALPYHKAGKLRFIAVASARRSELAADVPTLIEGGVKGFVAGSYIGLLAPTGTPADVLKRLQEALAATMRAPATIAKFRDLGADLATAEQMTPAGFAAYIRQDYDNSREAARVAGLKPE
jgi:tripartite-type tricarboxylate transporter receptor subunit TctC